MAYISAVKKVGGGGVASARTQLSLGLNKKIFPQRGIIEGLLWVIIPCGMAHLLLNIYILTIWVILLRKLDAVQIYFMIPQILTGRLNTLVNKFMALSRFTGVVYIIGVLSERTFSFFYKANEVQTQVVIFVIFHIFRVTQSLTAILTGCF